MSEIAQVITKRVFHTCLADKTLDCIEDFRVVDGLGLCRQGSDSRSQRLEGLLVSGKGPRDSHPPSQAEMPVEAAGRVPQHLVPALDNRVRVPLPRTQDTPPR